MNSYIKYFAIFAFVSLSSLIIACDNDGSSEPSQTFRFFDELDFVDDPSLMHDPENGIHLTFLEPIEAEQLPPPIIFQTAMTTDPAETTILSWAGLDAPASKDGIDYHVYDVALQGRYSLSLAMMNGETEDQTLYPISAVARMDTGEIVGAARVGGGVEPVFDLIPGNYIAIATTENFLGDALKEAEDLKEEDDVVPKDIKLCLAEILNNTVVVTWSMDEQATFIMNSFNNSGNEGLKESDLGIAPGPMVVEEPELPNVIQARSATYRDNFLTAFGFSEEELKTELLEPGVPEVPSCLEGEPICIDEDILVCSEEAPTPLCSLGTPMCMDGEPLCDPINTVTQVCAVGLTRVNDATAPNDGIDQFSSEELEVINSNINGIIGGM